LEQASDQLDRAAAEGMLRALLEHVTHVMGDRSTGGIRAAIHPDAQMRLLVSFGKPLRGRRAVVDALERGRPAVVFRARIVRFDWLDEVTALSFGEARYVLEEGDVVESDVCWLSEFRDGLIFRVEAFTTEVAARRAYEQARDGRLIGNEAAAEER
jgi:hypothetical protein